MCVCVHAGVHRQAQVAVTQSGCSMRREVLDSTESHAVRM